MHDLANRRYGRLTALSQQRQIKNGLSKMFWLCRCDCGNIKAVTTSELTRGITVSCGCYMRELQRAGRPKHGLVAAARLQGRRVPVEYRIWANMKSRCYRKANHNYAYYGGRGIAVCDEWRNDFAAFLRDMGSRPSPLHTIDRINNDGPYAPQNCRWVTQAEQNRNRRPRGPDTKPRKNSHRHLCEEVHS